MNNEEASSSQTVYHQEINIAEENEPISLPELVNDLLERIQITSSINKDKFSSIYKVPSRLRDVNPSSFTPRVVAIGPLHKGLENLKSMEEKKAIYVDELLTEVGAPAKETLTKCMKKVTDSIEKIKGCYFGIDKTYTDEAFAKMMVMDACFILQFINKLSVSGNLLSDNRLRSRSVALDLVLLENQIPYFVLQDIYNLTFGSLESMPGLTVMLYDLLERVNPFSKLKLENLSREKTPYHILGLLHEFYQPKGSEIPIIEKIPTAHSAVELHKVGVRFRPHQNTNCWPMAIHFEQSTHKPTFKMPQVLIDNFFEVVMRNLIVYEQYSPVKNYVTSYAMAMDMLAATPADIAKLAESNVIISHLGSNEKASNMISSICKDVTFLDFYYIESWTEAKKYYDSYWSKNFGLLKRKHFSTPWKAMALFAGIIVFLLSIVQFVFRVITFKSSRI